MRFGSSVSSIARAAGVGVKSTDDLANLPQPCTVGVNRESPGSDMGHRSTETGASERGMRLIIAYKLTKGAVELLLALALTVVLRAGDADEISAFALALKAHVPGAWSVRLIDFLLQAAAPHYVELVILALLLDGLLTLLEGWALYRAFTWGPWLVVIATGVLLPFEVVELARHLRVGRLLILLVNLAVVAYLGNRAIRKTAGSPVPEGR